MKSLLRLFLLITLLAGGPGARASLLSSIGYVSCNTGCTSPTIVNSFAPDGSTLTFSDQYGAVFAQAGYGTLRASVDSSYASGTGGGFSSGSSLAQFSDWIMLGGLAGPQKVTVILHLDGTLGSTGEQTTGTAASMTISLDVDGNTIALVADHFGNLAAPQAGASQGGLGATFELEYGVQLSLEALLAVTGSFGGYAHYANTASLEFIAPAGTTIQSGSGTEYLVTTFSIPEPATTALLLLGLATLAAARHRYRRI